MAFFSFTRQARTARCLLLTLLLITCVVHGADKPPVLVGLDAEFGLDNSISAQAIELSCAPRWPRSMRPAACLAAASWNW